MNKPELLDTLANKAGLTKQHAEAFLNAFEETVVEELKKGSEVTVTGFGTFSARNRTARKGVNPQKPSERIDIPRVTVPKFKAGKGLKDALKHVDISHAESNASSGAEGV